MSQGTIHGVVGYIRWSYYTAAQLEGYTVTRTGQTFALTGRIVLADRFKLNQAPLRFVAPTRKGAWTWPIRDLHITDDQVRAELGAPLP